LRNTFVNALVRLAEKDKNIYLITGDLGYGVLSRFWDKCPDQFINAGISEQNMTSAAAGMALEGKTVFTYSIGNFSTLRCLEQIRNDCAYHNANVKIVSVGGGFAYGPLGMSHHATEDIAIMRALPNVTVLAPGDLAESGAAAAAAVACRGVVYLRLGKGGEKKLHRNLKGFRVGKAIKFRETGKVCIFSTGGILDEAIKTAEGLAKKGIKTGLYSFPTVKPIDNALILKTAARAKLIVTMEEHNISGGFGSAVAEVLAQGSGRARQLIIGINDVYSGIVGTQEYLRDKYGLSAAKAIKRIVKEL
jgi:transketolase